MGEFFVRRPTVAIVIAIMMVIFGYLTMRELPISQYPEVVPPEIQVNSSYTGANALAVEQSVTTPLEQKINGVENLIYVRSINANDGTSSVRVTFEVGSDLDMANVLTQNRVSEAMASLPEEVKRLGVTVKKSLSFPLMLVALESPKASYDSVFLSNYANINVTDLVARIPGVGQVTLFGGSDYAMRIWVKPDDLQRQGLTVADLSQAIQRQNVIVPGGQIGGAPAPKGTEFTYTVKTADRLRLPEEFEKVIVKSSADGAIVRLGDVARVELGSASYNAEGRLNSKPAAVLAIYQTPGSNALQVVKSVKAAMESAKERFPEDLSYSIPLDTTRSVNAGIEEIVSTLIEAVILVVLVVFIFLQSWRATLIPLLTVPVSLMATFIVFPLIGFSINVLSLLGLVLAIGVVVDDAIVVVEAVIHHMQKGLSPKEATIKAMQEVTGPVIATTLVLAAVFLPVVLVDGITGQFYQQFAVTLVISVVFSSVNALTLSPALSAMLLRPATAQIKRGLLQRFFDLFNFGFDRFSNSYLKVVNHLVRKGLRVGLIYAIILIFTVLLGRSIPGGFIPEEDQGYILANIQLPDAASLERTADVATEVESILSEFPEIEYFTSIVGYSLVSQAFASNTAFIFISLKEWKERSQEGSQANQLVNRINARLMSGISSAAAFAFGPPAIPGLGTGSGFSLMLQDRSGAGPEFLAQQSQLFIEAASKRPEIGRIGTAFRSTVPQIYVDVDRDKVYSRGLNLGDVNLTLGTFLGGSYVNDFNSFGRLYRVYLQAEPEYRDQEGDLSSFYVRSADGQMLALNNVVSTKRTSGPEYTNRFNLFRSAEITGTSGEGFSSAQTLQALKEVAAETLPNEISFEWNAMSYQEEKASGGLAFIFALALVFAFLILAAQYESWRLPFGVLLGTPFVVFGTLLAIWIARNVADGYLNNIYTQISLVALIGMAAKNAILIVEYARMLQVQGRTPLDAAVEAAKVRIRPILMTAFSFILGVLPLVFATGAGAEGRKVMGLSILGGMVCATVIGVFITPAFYVLIEKFFGGKEKNASENLTAADH